MIYRDRTEAGKRLATQLMEYANRSDVWVLALPRGGVPVAFQVARVLRASLDIFLVRKLGVPGDEELAMGAIATNGVRVLNKKVVDYLRISGEVIDAVAAHELRELERRERIYRGNRPPAEVRGKTVILIDDGLATGSTMRSAAAALRQQQPARIVVAVPVASAQTCDEFRAEVDDIVCAVTPEPFRGVGNGTKTSRKRPTKRSTSCSRAHPDTGGNVRSRHMSSVVITIHKRIFIYSTWIILGTLQAILSGDRIYRAWLAGFFQAPYLLRAALLLGGGLLLIACAEQAATTRDPGLWRWTYWLTVLLSVLVFGMLIITTVNDALALLADRDVVRRDFIRLVALLAWIVVEYPLVVLFARTKLREHED